MLFVIASEILRGAIAEETKPLTTFALLGGFLVMMSLDVTPG
jgi:zinc transporter ZupT